ncbi:MAG: hypothetical protein V1799_13835 [bacterium]
MIYLKPSLRRMLLLALICFSIYFMTNYGGIRSPDNELVFTSAEHLLHQGTFAVDGGLDAWPGFGIAYAANGHSYPIFGPVQSVVLVPFVAFGEVLASTGWYQTMGEKQPRSHLIENGLLEGLYRLEASKPLPHAVRTGASLYNLIVTVLLVLVFYLIVLRFTLSEPASFFGSLVLGLGTLYWNYALTFFSEPLASLFMLLSFLALVCDIQQASDDYTPKRFFLSGLFAGLAGATHITGVLFIPFFFLIAAVRGKKQKSGFLLRYGNAIFFIAGTFLILFAIGLWNYLRFHSFFETGRGMSNFAPSILGYGVFTSPLPALSQLLIGPGKGLFLYSPAIILGVFGWVYFHPKHRQLSWLLLAMMGVRWMFIASRSDWHGGFCVGPRFLLMVIPFFILVFASWYAAMLQQKQTTLIAGVFIILILATTQQWIFAVGDVFKYLYMIEWFYSGQGTNLFNHDQLYTDWSFTPLWFGGEVPRGAFLLRWIPFSNSTVRMLGFVSITCCFTAYYLIIHTRLTKRSSDLSASR